MKIDVAEHAGLCFGVERAIDIALETASKNPDVPVYTVGALIHNPQTIQRLEAAGIRVVDSVDQVQDGVMIIRSHGLPPDEITKAKKRQIPVVDATCPCVKRVQKLASDLSNRDYQVVIIGEPDHPEVRAIVGYVKGQPVIISKPEELDQTSLGPRVGIIAQTTQTYNNYEECVAKIRQKAHDVSCFRTICGATSQRQEEARRMAQSHQVMLVIGGKNSANTRKLLTICSEQGAKAYHVESSDEVDPAWFDGVKTVGVVAGASTPQWVIEEVIQKMSELDENNMDKKEPSESGELSNIGNPSEAPTDIRPGVRLRAKVTKITNDEVYVDIGAKSDGLISLKELSNRPVSKADEVVSPGDQFDVIVIKAENEEGHPILSKKRADMKDAWDRLKNAHTNNAIVEALVTERVKGGLSADVGVRGFIPASQASCEFIADLGIFVNRTLPCKVIELDENRHNVILSHRVVEEEEFEKSRKEALDRLEVESIVSGTVKRLTNFGAFIEVGGGLEGLLHISEMPWSRVKHPSDLLHEGEVVKVKVLGVDKESMRISLGLKQVQPDPWETVTKRYRPGQTVEGEVARVVDFGAFVRLEDGVEGLVHVSQLSNEHMAKPSDVVKPGQKVHVRILNVDQPARRISLSMREAQPKPPKREEEPKMVATEEKRLTLGDMFGDLFASSEKQEK